MVHVVRLLLISFFCAALFFLIIAFIGQKKNSTSKFYIISPLVEPISEYVKGIANSLSGKLKQTVVSSLDGTHGTYSVVIKNLKTGESYSQNESTKYDSASLYKLWVMGTVYEQLDAGKLEKDDVLSSSIEDLNEKFQIATEEAELTEGEVEMSVNEALSQMITISHNYAALLLSSKVRLSNVKNLIYLHGLSSSSVGTVGYPTTTAKDTARFYEELYKKRVVSEKASDEMLTLLKKQKLNDRIPKYLPDNIEIAHKTGELGEYKHDGGIVFSQKGDYIIVVMSKSNNPQAAAERIALLSKDVYEYFEKE